MITQETRERMDNLIRCIQAKLEGKTIEWFDTVQKKWRAFAADDWCFMSTSKLRIAPEPQEKLKKWAVIWDSGKSSTFDTLGDAESIATDKHTIIELTETARIEPKKREQRRVWANAYGDEWGSGYPSPEAARNAASGASEIAVEFMEVVK